MAGKSITDLKRKPKRYRATVVQYPDHAELYLFGLPGAVEAYAIRTPTDRGAYNKCMAHLHKHYGIMAQHIAWTRYSIDKGDNLTEIKEL
jgi:hypothetical protein